MRINELARLMGKTREEVEDILNASDVVEINLNEFD